jgi:hypothetical protein
MNQINTNTKNETIDAIKTVIELLNESGQPYTITTDNDGVIVIRVTPFIKFNHNDIGGR